MVGQVIYSHTAWGNGYLSSRNLSMISFGHHNIDPL